MTVYLYLLPRTPRRHPQGLTNEELLRGIRTAWDGGWRQVRLAAWVGWLARLSVPC